eukprot:tig00001049_g6656.t1
MAATTDETSTVASSDDQASVSALKNGAPSRPVRVVVKIGTSSIMEESQRFLSLSTLSSLVETLCSLRQKNYQVVLVTSGAVGIGCQRLRIGERPKTLAGKQAVAAVGQSRLMRVYDDLFSIWDQPIAQILLTRENLGERTGYMNAKNTFDELLNMGVIPIVNENDTVAIEELRFGDNDTLSALVASLVDADWLFLMTDVQFLYDSDPRSNPGAKPIYEVPDLNELRVSLGSTGSQWGTGGMSTKLVAATLATAAGVRTVITLARHPGNISKMLAGEKELGSVFLPKSHPIPGKKRWIVHGLVPSGTLFVDAGAVEAIRDKRKSLFAAGITAVEGDFTSNTAVRICAASSSQEIARGLVNYSSDELKKIKGVHSKDTFEVLGYHGPEMVIHRHNLVRL